MSIDDLLTPEQQLRAYNEAQSRDMKAVYQLLYATDGDHGAGLSFKEFLPYYVEHGYAKAFHAKNYHKYFKTEETK